MKITGKVFDQFLWRFSANKRSIETTAKQEQYTETIAELMSRSKEDLVNSVIALTKMSFQDRETIEKLLNELKKGN